MAMRMKMPEARAPFDAQAFLQAVVSQREDLLHSFFVPAATIRWPNTREVFTLAQYLRANCEYPGTWQGELLDLHRQGDLVITVARVWQEDASLSAHVCSFMRLQHECIFSMDEYWCDDGEPPAWRQQMMLGE